MTCRFDIQPTRWTSHQNLRIIGIGFGHETSAHFARCWCNTFRNPDVATGASIPTAALSVLVSIALHVFQGGAGMRHLLTGIERDRIEIERAHVDIEKARIDIEKSRVEIEKAREELKRFTSWIHQPGAEDVIDFARGELIRRCQEWEREEVSFREPTRNKRREP